MKKLNKKSLINLIQKIKQGILNKKYWSVVIALVSIVAGVYWGVSAGILWYLFFSFALYDWDNRIIGVFALVSLASCPFLLQFKQDVLAEQMAVYAFFFLSMTVGLQLIEFKRFPERFPDDKQSNA